MPQAAGTFNLTYTPSTSSIKVKILGTGTTTSSIKWGNLQIWKPEMIQTDVLVDICEKDNDRYVYGFNGMLKDNEWAGIGNFMDYGARGLDSRTGRWLAVDPLTMKYPFASPYNFSLNTPLQAKDPDGKVVIFINGLWGKPNHVGRGGTSDYWGERWIKKVQDRIGDHAAPIFFDGAMGGTSNILKNTSNSYRISEGRAAGFMNAGQIVGNLKTNSAGDITETIKIVTNSMGAAYERGFTEGIKQWIKFENSQRQDYNSRLKGAINSVKTREADGIISSETAAWLLKDLGPEKKLISNVRFEMVVDLDAHKVNWKDPNAENSYYMISNESDRNFWENTLTDPMPVSGAEQLGVNSDGSSRMTSHHSSGAKPEDFPQATSPDPNPQK